MDPQPVQHRRQFVLHVDPVLVSGCVGKFIAELHSKQDWQKAATEKKNGRKKKKRNWVTREEKKRIKRTDFSIPFGLSL